MISAKSFGIGILFLLNAQDAKEIANLAVIRWTSAFPRASVGTVSRNSDTKDILLSTALSQISSQNYFKMKSHRRSAFQISSNGPQLAISHHTPI